MNNGASAPAWPAADQFDNGDPSFGNLLDFDTLDLDFSLDYTNGGLKEHASNQQLTELADSLDVQHLQNPFSPGLLPDHRDGGPGAQQQQQQNTMGGSAMVQPGDHFFDFSMSQYGLDQVYNPHAGVPPTPNSSEMHPDSARYLQQMDTQDAIFGQGFHTRKEDASFTPLASPAVTDYTVIPGTYFSPLTSPALNAQNHQRPHAQPNQYATPGSSTGTSPLDKDIEMMGDAAIAQPDQGRRLRNNKRSAPRTTNPTARVRQSPIVKPGRRKATVSSIAPKEVGGLVEEAQRSRPAQHSSAGLEVPRSSDSSEFDSVSPETLSEMGPPPKPGSVTHSPAMFAQGGQANGQGVCPATPASLMRLQQSPSFAEFSEGQPPLDDLMLPEPSLEKPLLSHIDTSVRNDNESTPRMSARKTPKFGPMSTPSAGAAQSGKPSPMLSAVASPASPGFALGNGRRADPKTARNTKKRNSVCSTLVSPALRPKISPSIKPLLPEGGKSEDTHAMLLASKSNYQNILDGTTVPGVVYPTSLSTNLTSKRTSHKIAEQGRRNRINTALQEMQALLPSPKIGAEDAVAAPSPDLSSATQSSNSKAAKVESAIDYIKQLQKQCSDKDRQLVQKDQEVEALREQLAALRRGDTTNSSDTAEAQVTTEKKSSPDSEDAT